MKGGRSSRERRRGHWQPPPTKGGVRRHSCWKAREVTSVVITKELTSRYHFITWLGKGGKEWFKQSTQNPPVFRGSQKSMSNIDQSRNNGTRYLSWRSATQDTPGSWGQDGAYIFFLSTFSFLAPSNASRELRWSSLRFAHQQGYHLVTCYNYQLRKEWKVGAAWREWEDSENLWFSIVSPPVLWLLF